MPRRRSRYAKLARDLRVSGGNPTNPRVAAYQRFITGQSSINVTNTIPKGGRKLFPIRIFSFTRDFDTLTTTTPILTGASGYSMSGFFAAQGARVEGTGVDKLLGHDLDAAAKARAAAAVGFYPALVKTSFPASGATPQTRKSGVTEEDYEYTYERTFSMPFGRAVLTPEGDEVERRMEIAEDLKTRGNPPTTISFESEVIRDEGGLGTAEFDPDKDAVSVS